MTKRIVAKTGTYNKDGQEKGEYTKLGVMLESNDGGEYMLLDPCVSLSGILAKQNSMAIKGGKQVRDSVMISIFLDDGQQQSQSAPQQQQAPAQQQAPQMAPSYQTQSAPQHAPQNQGATNNQPQYDPNAPPF